MKEFEDYINGHLPDKCDYAIVVDDTNDAKLHPVYNDEELVMLKLQCATIDCIKTYDELYAMCLKSFGFANTIGSDTYKMGSIDPIASMLAMIEMKYVAGLNSLTVKMPKVRQVMPKLIAEEMAGIQPMFTNTYIKKRP